MPTDPHSLLSIAIKLLQDNWQTAFSALAGTFLGAYLAFIFQRRYTDKKELEANLAAAKSAQFAIAVQLNAVRNIREQVLDPTRNDPNRHLTLTPFTVHAEYPRLNITALTFMLKDEGAQLLGELLVSEHMFLSLLGALEQRNTRHEVMQRAIATQGPHAALDQATVAILRDITDSVFGLAEDASKSLQTAFDTLAQYVEKVFPKSKALGLQFKQRSHEL